MSDIREELVYAAINRANVSIDYNIYDDIHKRYEFQKQTILADNSLTNDDKTYAIELLNKAYDRNKIKNNSGTRRTCENCNQECLATLYCEYCVQNYLKANFSNWTSGNNDIDNLIQKCQIETLRPDTIIEWIPYNNLQNIEYLTKGGFSEIYTAVWIDGGYYEWDSKEQKLIRFGEQKVILKGLDNVENANQRWFEEAESHLKISNKSPVIVQCYGLTQNQSNGNYMLVMNEMNIDLRKYLQQTQNQLTWKEKITIVCDILVALNTIHSENSIHRDLHSGNILYLNGNQRWYISDLGFCGPANKSTESIYGNLPYIAPEVISGKKTTVESDIYSIGMLMWEISSGQSPFSYYENDYKLALNIINGMRPKVISGTPLKYENLMKQCWDADPLKRPDIDTLEDEIYVLLQYYQNISNEILQQETNNNLEKNKLINNSMSKHISSKLFTSKIHQFKNLPEPRNATEEEQEAFHSKSYDCFNIPDNTPEVISGKKTTVESDIYSIGMLMWEISSGQSPFSYYENDYKLALNIINGMRPKVISGTPLKYENLMKQCWDADPLKRPDIDTLEDEIYVLLQYYQNISNEILQQETNNNLEKNKLINNSMSKHISSKLFTSKIHQFKNLPEPRNATEEEQEAFHSKSYDCFNIPDNIEDFNNSSNQNYAGTFKASCILKGNQINYGKEIVEQQQIKQYNLNINDEDETYDDKNFHSEDDDVFEIPDGKII
ncbi:kinase-like protein [Rhizophagus irregularis]|nr:kinase-like protein [Rhizophagus irregularis]